MSRDDRISSSPYRQNQHEISTDSSGIPTWIQAQVGSLYINGDEVDNIYDASDEDRPSGRGQDLPVPSRNETALESGLGPQNWNTMERSGRGGVSISGETERAHLRNYSDLETVDTALTLQTVPPRKTAELNDDPNIRYDKRCEMCNRHVRQVWYCNVCKFSLCNTCWESQFVHRQPFRGGRGEVPHEKTDPMIAEKVQKVMFPPVDEWTREQLYRDDEITSWFGVERPSDFGPPMFQDYGRFADLMANTDPIRNNQGDSFVADETSLGRDNRTPSLVSFVGQTGAGKSTLVKLLIDFGLKDAERYSSPVVGPRGAHLPTSEDVHLYMDPRTANLQGPVLYADCEGLEGGEREPLGAKFRKKRHRDIEAKEKALKNNKVISERELIWANGPLERSREFAVTNLYPRLLYTFSDVIVFVLRNPRQDCSEPTSIQVAVIPC